MILRLAISGRLGSHASRECEVEADFAIDRTNLFDFQSKPPRGIRSSYNIAEEFVRDFAEFVLLKGQKNAERSLVLARKPLIT
jgi:hypothetical protein